METDYEKYRGKCKQMSEELCAKDVPLTLTKGWYHCPIWGAQEHWWCKKPDGTVVDPTANQFPSKGIGEYEEYVGILSCECCGIDVKEDDAYLVEHHVYCSYKCYGTDIGFGHLV